MSAPPGELLDRDFFARPSREVAPELLGCVLEHETVEGLVAVELTEVEAYEGVTDPASHSYRGRTARNAIMWGPPGFIYVYFTYGMHYCVNVVCQPAGTSSAVLVRAGRIVAGEELARRRRAVRPLPPSALGLAAGGDGPAVPPGPIAPGAGPAPAVSGRRLPSRDLARGPGRLCQALAITLAENGLDGSDPASPVRVRPARSPARSVQGDRPVPAGPVRVSTGPRVGVSAAAEVPWRYWIADDPTVSVYRPAKQRPAGS